MEKAQSTAPTNASGATSTGHADDHASVGAPALQRAINSPEFVDLSARIQEFDFTDGDGRVVAIDAAFSSGAFLAVRSLLAPSASLRRDNPFLAALHKCLPELRAYLSDAQATDAVTGAIRDDAEDYLMKKAVFDEIVAGKFRRDWLNANAGGANLLEDLIKGVPATVVSEFESYTVPSCLDLIGGELH